MKSLYDQEVCQLLGSSEYRIARCFMITLRKAARIPLVDSAAALRAKNQQHRITLKSRHKHHELNKPEEEQDYYEAAISYGPASNLAFVLFVISVIHIALVMYHQYKLDWSRVRHEYLTFRRQLGTNDSRCLGHKCNRRRVPEELLQELNKTIHEESLTLDQLGQPLRDLTYFGTSVYCFLFLSNFVSYLMPQFNFNLLNPYDSFVFRILVDYKRELKLCQQLISEQVNEFLISHRNSMRTLIIHEDTSGRADRLGLDRVIGETLELLERDRFIEHELLAMERRNELLPANRRVKWIRGWLRRHMMFTITGLYFGLSGTHMNIAISCLFPTDLHENKWPWRDYHLNDWLIICESSLILILLCLAVSLYDSTLTFSSFDLRWLANDLRRQHEMFISRSWDHLNMTRYSLLRKRAQNDNQRRRLNCELVALLVKFRIFVRQLASERRSGGFNAFRVLIAFFLLPVASRLHAPYFDPSLSGINLFLAIASVFVLMSVSIGLLPPCEMFTHCVLLHRAQVKLLAHLIEVEQLRPNFYNGHLVSRLRRETSASDRLKDDFAISFAGFYFTYSSVIRFYFWFGALSLAAMFRPGTMMVTSELARSAPSSAAHEDTKRPSRDFPIMVESILDDPFGILSW